MTSRTIAPAPVRRSVTVPAEPERAFDIFTRGFGRWWPATHSIGAAPQVQAVLEPGPGGRWYEVGADGSQTQWGHVLAWEPPDRLLLAWQIAGTFTFDPDLVTEVEVRFTREAPGRTRVDLEHRNLDRLGAHAAMAREKFDSPNGWGGLLARFADTVVANPTL